MSADITPERFLATITEMEGWLKEAKETVKTLVATDQYNDEENSEFINASWSYLREGHKECEEAIVAISLTLP